MAERRGLSLLLVMALEQLRAAVAAVMACVRRARAECSAAPWRQELGLLEIQCTRCAPYKGFGTPSVPGAARERSSTFSPVSRSCLIGSRCDRDGNCVQQHVLPPPRMASALCSRVVLVRLVPLV
mmetsp:Transcript_36412/g.95654  ORF Transcript_36412/g.95654 Transcript_36412/m.95654 type:complete len:125 (-) Transcript_36412:59-433(-)